MLPTRKTNSELISKMGLLNNDFSEAVDVEKNNLVVLRSWLVLTPQEFPELLRSGSINRRNSSWRCFKLLGHPANFVNTFDFFPPIIQPLSSLIQPCSQSHLNLENHHARQISKGIPTLYET